MDVDEVGINKGHSKPFSFENVRKETAGETFKCWNKLLKSQTVENIENFKKLLSPNVPLSPFEEKLRLIAIDTLQLENEVVNILLSQNDFSIKRVLRCKWFFRNVSADFCIQELFPKVSYSVRFKIINRLSRNLENKEEAEKIFLYLEANYVGDGAEILLPKCSSAFVLNYCKNVKPLISFENWRRVRILNKICRRYPEVGVNILGLNCDFEKQRGTMRIYVCRSIIQYLAGNHMNLFLLFFKKYHSELDIYAWIFGRRLARKFIKREKDFFFQSNLLNTYLFEIKYIFLMFDTNDRIRCITRLLHLQADKPTIDHWVKANIQITVWLSVIQPKDRYLVVATAFKELYNKNIEDVSRSWTYGLLELIPTKERQCFAEKLEKIFLSTEDKYRESLNDRFWWDQKKIEQAIYFYEFPIAFEKLKKLIKKTPAIHSRENIMLYMLKCCKINNDIKGLEQVVDYVAEYHRHENPNILSTFTKNVCNLFPSLPSNIRQKLRAFLQFFVVKGPFESDSFAFLTEREIYQRLEDKEDAEDLMRNFFEIVRKSGNSRPFLSHYHSNHTKTLLLRMGEEIKRWIQDRPTDQTSERIHDALMGTFIQFNKVHKNDQVSLSDLPGYVELVKELYRNKYKTLGVKDWPIETLKTCSIRGFDLGSLTRIFCHLLKTNPELIMNDLEAVLDHTEINRFHLVLVKYVTFMGKRDNLKEIALNRFRNGDSIPKRKNALKMYSHLCTIEEFTEAVEQYIPKEDNVRAEDSEEFVEMQLAVPSVIKHVRPRWKNLDLILKFYRGDFLKQVMLSFLATCCHTRVDFIVPFLREYLTKIPPKVSYTKQIIRIIFRLSSRSENLAFCLDGWRENKHYSVRKIIFQFLVSLFLRKPTREVFDTIVNCVLESDLVVLEDENLDRMKMPKEYMGEYALALWKVSSRFNLNEDFRNIMLSNINSGNINLFPVEFCEQVMREYLFHPRQSVKVVRFAVFFCVAGQGTVEGRVETIIRLMRETKAKVLTVRSFFGSLRNESHSNPDKFMDAMALFMKNWPDSYSIFEEKFMYLYHDLLYRILRTSKDRGGVSLEFGRQLRQILSGMNNLNDMTVIVVDTLRQFIGEIHQTDLPFHPLFVCRELMGDLGDKTMTNIALGALPSDLGYVFTVGDGPDNGGEDKKKINEMYRIVENLNDDIFRAYFWRVFEENEPLMET